MYTGKLALTNKQMTPFALSNEYEDLFDFKECVEEAQTVEEVISLADEFHSYGRKHKLAKDTSKYTRLETVDTLGNVHYLLVYKEV